VTHGARFPAPQDDPRTPHLEARGLACDVGGRPGRGGRRVLDGVDLIVRHGEMVGIIGPNGTGKSTLLRVLAGVRPAAVGEVLVDGTPLQERSGRSRAREIAMVGQEEQPQADLLVGEVVALGRTPHRPPWAGGDAAERDAVLAALAAVDMDEAVDRSVEQLSGGERRRVLLARGLAQEAPLLVLDEPTNHLDVRHQLSLMRMIRRLERTVVVAIHDLNLAMAVCDRVVVLHDGGVHVAGEPESVLTPDTVREVFGVEAVPVTHPRTGHTHLLFTTHEAEEPA
jgi:iron complex transport system ATP-binding protein